MNCNWTSYSTDDLIATHIHSPISSYVNAVETEMEGHAATKQASFMDDGGLGRCECFVDTLS